MTKKITYKHTPEFERDLKKLLKKFPTLTEDLETAKKNALELFHERGFDSKAIFEISSFCSDVVKVCKLKKFSCRSLKGRGNRSGIRVIYAYLCDSMTVVFLEMYFKGDKEKEDKERIKNFLKENDF